jgi:hypothetical protein
MGIHWAPDRTEHAWVSRATVTASLVLAMGTIYMVAEAAGWLRTYRRRGVILMGIIGVVFVLWMLTGLFGAVAQVPRLQEN